MNLQDISLKYFGVKSTPEYDDYLINRIFDYCKDSNQVSSCEVKITKKENRFHAVITFITKGRKKLFVFQAKSFPEIIFKLFNLLKKKLERFKISKFHQEKLSYLQPRGHHEYC